MNERPTATGARFLRRLTERERSIIVLLCENMSNREIAAGIGTTEQVVKNYARNLYIKASVHDRMGLAIFCFLHRVVVCPCRSHIVGNLDRAITVDPQLIEPHSISNPR